MVITVFKYSDIFFSIQVQPPSSNPVSADVILLPVLTVRNENRRSMRADKYSLMCLVGEINETQETPVASRFVIYRAHNHNRGRR